MKRQQAITAILAALPALILAACAWLNAQAKAVEAWALSLERTTCP